jgi:hypothetical protein
MREASWKTEIATNILSVLEAIDSLGRDLVALLERVVQREEGQEQEKESEKEKELELEREQKKEKKKVFVATTLVSVLDWLVIFRDALGAMLRVLTAFRLSVSSEEVKVEEWLGIDWERRILDKPDWSAVRSCIPSPSQVKSVERELQKVDEYIKQNPALFGDFVVFSGESFAERFRFGVAGRIAAIARIVGEKLGEHRLSEMASEYHEGKENIERIKQEALLYLKKFVETLETILIKVMPNEKVGEAQRYFRKIVEDLEGAVEEGNAPLLGEKLREIENFAGAVANLAKDEERKKLIESMIKELKKKVSGLAAMIWQSTRGMLTKFRLLRECFLRRI